MKMNLECYWTLRLLSLKSLHKIKDGALAKFDIADAEYPPYLVKEESKLVGEKHSLKNTQPSLRPEILSIILLFNTTKLNGACVLLEEGSSLSRLFTR